MELLRLVFGLQNRLQKAEHELDSMKRDTFEKKFESEHLAVRDDMWCSIKGHSTTIIRYIRANLGKCSESRRSRKVEMKPQA